MILQWGERPLSVANVSSTGQILGWGEKAIEIRSAETGHLDGVFMHEKKALKFRFLCERNDKVTEFWQVWLDVTKWTTWTVLGLHCWYDISWQVVKVCIALGLGRGYLFDELLFHLQLVSDSLSQCCQLSLILTMNWFENFFIWNFWALSQFIANIQVLYAVQLSTSSNCVVYFLFDNRIFRILTRHCVIRIILIKINTIIIDY